MACDIPTRFHKVLSRHLREIERTKMYGIIIIIVKITLLLTKPHSFPRILYFQRRYTNHGRVLFKAFLTLNKTLNP
jgi:hypothetical protein